MDILPKIKTRSGADASQQPDPEFCDAKELIEPTGNYNEVAKRACIAKSVQEWPTDTKVPPPAVARSPSKALQKAQEWLSELGMVAMPRLMTVREFCHVSGVSESEVRHNPEKFDHLMVRMPVRKRVFSAAAVLRGLNLGSLCKQI